MIDFKLDPLTNDLVFQDFDFQLVDGVDQIAQNLAIRLRFILGEWFLDINEGIPYFQFIFIKAPNQIQVESIFKQEIVNTKDIIEITSFNSDFNKTRRSFSIRFSCLCIGNEEIQKEMELSI